MNQGIKTIVLPSVSLMAREFKRFVRQKSRIIGAVGTPLIFWMVIGSGIGRGYLEFFFPGSLVMVLLFTSIFSTISLIEDRNEGFLQSVLVAPVSRMSIVLGKSGGAMLLAAGHAFILLLIGYFCGLPISAWKLLFMFGLFLFVSSGLTLMGFVLAWKMDSIQGFHAIMNLVLLPMWLLSGAVFSTEFAPPWLKGLMIANPMTYIVALVRRALYFGSEQDLSRVPSSLVSIGVILVFTLVLFGWSALEVRNARSRS